MVFDLVCRAGFYRRLSSTGLFLSRKKKNRDRLLRRTQRADGGRRLSGGVETPHSVHPRSTFTNTGLVSRAVNEHMRMAGLPIGTTSCITVSCKMSCRPLIAFRIWGVSYASDQRLGPYLSALSALFLFLITIRICRFRLWALLAGFILWWRVDLFLPDRTVFRASHGPIWLCQGLAEPMARRSRLWLFAGGFFCVGVLLYSLEMGATLMAGVGLYALLSLVFGPWRDGARTLAWISAGAAAGVSIFLIYLLCVGAVFPFFRDLFFMFTVRLSTWADKLPSHVFNGEPLHGDMALRTVVYLNAPPLLAVGTGAYALGHKKARLSRVALWNSPGRRRLLPIFCLCGTIGLHPLEKRHGDLLGLVGVRRRPNDRLGAASPRTRFFLGMERGDSFRDRRPAGRFRFFGPFFFLVFFASRNSLLGTPPGRFLLAPCGPRRCAAENGGHSHSRGKSPGSIGGHRRESKRGPRKRIFF